MVASILSMSNDRHCSLLFYKAMWGVRYPALLVSSEIVTCQEDLNVKFATRSRANSCGLSPRRRTRDRRKLQGIHAAQYYCYRSSRSGTLTVHRMSVWHFRFVSRRSDFDAITRNYHYSTMNTIYGPLRVVNAIVLSKSPSHTLMSLR